MNQWQSEVRPHSCTQPGVQANAKLLPKGHAVYSQGGATVLKVGDKFCERPQLLASGGQILVRYS